MEKISPDKCKHKKWMILTSSGGDRDGLSQCNHCGLLLKHSERLGWESLKNQKIISIISVVLSIIAIIISVATLIFK